MSIVNDSLTQMNWQLLNSVRKAKAEKKYTYLLVLNGRIYMRKNQGDRFVVIKSEEDIAKLDWEMSSYNTQFVFYYFCLLCLDVEYYLSCYLLYLSG